MRQFFPKGTDLSGISQTELNDVARLMNQSPRKTLGWKTPKKPWPKNSRPSDQPLNLKFETKLIVLLNWPDARPQVGSYVNPISWAIAQIKAGGDVALGLYSVQKSDGTAIVGAVFDTEEPIIPDAPRLRVAVSLSYLLSPVLARAGTMQSRVVN